MTFAQAAPSVEIWAPTSRQYRVRGNEDISVIETVLFDASGTLFDDLSVVRRVTNAILEGGGHKPVGLRRFRREFHEPLSAYLTNQGVGFDESAFPRVVARLYDASGVRPFPEAMYVLKALRARGCTLGVVSGTPRKVLDSLLKRFALTALFHVTIAMEDCNSQKPSPLPIEMALKRLGSPPIKSVAYVGDMREDVIAARAARVTPVAVYRLGSFNTRGALESAGPDHLLGNLGGLLRTGLIGRNL